MILRKIIARWLAACQAGGRVPQLPSLVVNCGTDHLRWCLLGSGGRALVEPSGRVNMPCFHPLRAFRSSEVHEKSESTRSYSTLILGRRLLKGSRL